MIENAQGRIMTQEQYDELRKREEVDIDKEATKQWMKYHKPQIVDYSFLTLKCPFSYPPEPPKPSRELRAKMIISELKGGKGKIR